MNNRGQNLMLAILTAVMVFMAGMLFLNHIMGDVSFARTVGMDCASDTISDGTKATCIGIDFVVPIILISIVSISIGAIISRFNV